MREKGFLISVLLVLRVRAVSELCKVYSETGYKVGSANSACEGVSGTLWLPQSADAAKYR